MSGGHRNPSTALAQTLVDELVRAGVRHAVLAPGSRSTALALALAARDELTVHVRHDERSAAFVALGLGRATGVPAVVVTTSGTAVANLAPAIVEADAAGVPLLALTANRPAELHDVGANQTIRQDDLFAGRVRWRIHLPAAAGHATEPATWRSTVDRAVAAATGVAATTGDGLPGPVHVDVAFREPTVPDLDDGRTSTDPYPVATDGRADGRAWTRFARPVVEPDVTALARRLSGRRVLVVAGDVARPIAALEAFTARGWPVVAEPTAGPHHGVGLPHGPLLLGCGDWLERVRPELVLRLGRPTLVRPVHTALIGVPTIQVTAAGLVDPARAAGDAIVADPADLLAALAAVAPDPPPSAWAEAWLAASVRAAELVRESLDPASVPSGGAGSDTGAGGESYRHSEPAVARRVAAAAGARPLVVASSLPIRDLDTYADVTGGRVYANRGVSGIDGFVSTAVGVALGVGPTVALAGDLAFLHDHNGLLVDDPAAVPLTLVVVDNDGGGLFHHVPAVRVDQFERLFATPHGRDLVAIARAAGVSADVVTVDEVGDAVRASGPSLRVLVVRTDRHHGAAVRRSIATELAARLRPT